MTIGRMIAARRLSTVLVVSLLVLVGCGDSDEEATPARSSTTTASSVVEPSEEEFAAEVNAICAASGAAMGEIFGPLAQSDGPPSQELLQSTYDALLGQLRDVQSDLEALTPPSAKEDDWAALVAAHDDVVAVVEQQGLAYFDDQENAFAEVEKMAVEMGFDACGGGQA